MTVYRIKFLSKKQLDALISQIYFRIKLYMFRTVRLSIIRSLFTVHPAKVYVIQLSSRIRMELQIIPDPVRKLSTKLYYIYEGWNFNSGNYLFTTDTK